MVQISSDQGRGTPGGPAVDVLPARPPVGPPPGPPPGPVPQQRAKSSHNMFYAAAVVIGIALGAFGIIRLTAEDAELGRLDEELAALEAEEDDLRASVTEARAQEALIVAATEELDAALVDLAASFDAFVDGQTNVVDAWNLLLDSSVSLEDEAARFDTEVRPAVTAAQATVTELLEALTRTQAAYGALQDALATQGG